MGFPVTRLWMCCGNVAILEFVGSAPKRQLEIFCCGRCFTPKVRPQRRHLLYCLKFASPIFEAVTTKLQRYLISVYYVKKMLGYEKGEKKILK